MWTLDLDRTPPHWRLETPTNAVLAFSTRRGGVSRAPWDTLNLGRSVGDRTEAVEENRHRFLAALDLDSSGLATAGQVHGRAVATVTGPGHVPGHDALVTTRPGLALAVTTADCLALLFDVAGAVGAAHAGWRGIADGMPAAALEAVARAAARPVADVTVHLGPCIRACCYEVREDVLDRFPAGFAVRRGDRWHLDLIAATRHQLERAGVPPGAILDLGACTACHPDDYFSHRRDRGATGRMWAVAARRS
jgi:YfiH family protein